MTHEIEGLYQDIGRAALACAESLAGKLLLYAEVEDGVVSADIFFVNHSGVVQFRFCPPPIKALIYSLWESWQKQEGNREWRVMCYVIDGGKFSIDLVYPDQIDAHEDVSDRRPLVVKKHFGDMQVDYSRPK